MPSNILGVADPKTAETWFISSESSQTQMGDGLLQTDDKQC